MNGTWLDRSRTPPAGRVLAAVSVVPALATAGWLLAGVAAVAGGWFRPVPMLLAGGLLVLVLAGLGVWLTPRAPVPRVTWPQTAAVGGLAVASLVFNGVLHGEQLIVRRDPGTYAQYAIWLARHGSMPIPYDLSAFGGSDPFLRFDSVGFYDFGGAVVPQFMPGAPIVDAAGYWLGGLTGMLWMPAVLGGLAVLVIGGLAARLIGGWWAPLAALVFAVALPILYTSRTTFSEMPSLVLLFGGIALTLDARFRPKAAALAGLVLGLAVVVRIDALRDLLPVLGYAGLVAALRASPGRRAAYAPMGLPLAAGLLAGAGVGLLTGYTLARPYLLYLSTSVRPLLGIAAVVLAVSALCAAFGPAVIPRLTRPVRWPGILAASGVVLVMTGFAAWPWLRTVRRFPTNPDDRANALFIAGVQKANGLPVDPSRIYTEQTLWWVIWYIGLPAVILATLGAAVLTRRVLRGRDLAWALPLAIIAWTTVTTLWRPAITPDHPWASRRLVPVVLPGLILLAVWGVRRLRDHAGERRLTGWARRLAEPGRRRARDGVLVAGCALLVAPPVVTSIGTAFSPAERGEAAAIAELCATIPRDAAVLIIERATADRFTQVVRGMCGVPAARVPAVTGDVPPPAVVRRLSARIRASGRQPVLLAAQGSQLTPYGPATLALRLRTRQDERSLIEAPNGTWSLAIDVWSVVPPPD
ncbi:hypothetical protein [Sphaerisporangium aureirubrum]|uniref:Glycosyltransferase RgtA/B/C/D-like domain-containing protein n=1 Tax=Sphaerisporangium aureirubrum TaxID=1544736 RepID=A0ABW1NEA6_9ACTN